MLAGFEIVLAILIFGFAAGSLLGLIRRSHWFFRGWEYPRLQIAAFLVGLSVVYALTNLALGDWTLRDMLTLALAGGITAWHLMRVFVFLPIAPNQVVEDDPTLSGIGVPIRVLTSNVEMENTSYGTFVDVVAKHEPDVVVVLETDDGWDEGLAPLKERYRHHIAIPQDNWYGMAFFTNLELLDHEVRYIVQDDIPSIHARLRADHGVEFTIRCLHPRPPEPIRGTHATSRDAELVVVGREIGDIDEPTIVTGDLNDVAWSHTTRLFLRLSGLLDPRRGRGLFTTWPVDHPFWRVPLDHFFHSEEFTYEKLQRLDDIGSDHFPIMIDLVYRQSAAEVQQPVEKFDDDEDEAQHKIDEAEEVNDRPVHSEQRVHPDQTVRRLTGSITVRGAIA